MTPLFRPFDVVVVALGEGRDAKRRPALVVSNPEFEKATGLVWLAMITSSEHERRFADILIQDLASTGLPSTSMVRAGKLTTMAVGKIKRRLGTLGEADRASARIALRAASGFS